MNAPAPRAIYTTAPRATFYGHGAGSACVPTSWSDAQVVAFGQSDPAARGVELRVTSVVRVPCDCRPGFVHIQLGGK